MVKRPNKTEELKHCDLTEANGTNEWTSEQSKEASCCFGRSVVWPKPGTQTASKAAAVNAAFSTVSEEWNSTIYSEGRNDDERTNWMMAWSACLPLTLCASVRLQMEKRVLVRSLVGLVRRTKFCRFWCRIKYAAAALPYYPPLVGIIIRASVSVRSLVGSLLGGGWFSVTQTISSLDWIRERIG